MEETGCPNLQHVRMMLSLHNNIVPVTVEELLVQLALSDNSWERALKKFNEEASSAPKSGAIIHVGSTTPYNIEDANYIKTIENVKLITGCPSFELCRLTMDAAGRDAGVAIQELQTLFITNGEKWPNHDEIATLLSANTT